MTDRPKFQFNAYVCEGDEASIALGGFTLKAKIYRDDSDDAPDDNDDGFWPSQDPGAPGYVEPAVYEAEQAKAARVMAAWKNDEWFFCGVCVTAWMGETQLTEEFGNALWSVEANYPDSDNIYLGQVADDLVEECLANARTVALKLANDLAVLLDA